MTLPKENNRLTRFIHEHIHETTKDLLRDFVADIITKWEAFKEKELCPTCETCPYDNLGNEALKNLRETGLLKIKRKWWKFWVEK